MSYSCLTQVCFLARHPFIPPLFIFPVANSDEEDDEMSISEMVGTAIATMNDLVDEVSPRGKGSSQCFPRGYITQALDDTDAQDITQDSQDINELDEDVNMVIPTEEVSHWKFCLHLCCLPPSCQVLGAPETQEIEENDAALARSMALGLRSKRTSST